MSCNIVKYQKSTVTSVSNALQTVTPKQTALQIGDVEISSGCSVCAQSDNMRILHTGLFRAVGAVTFEPLEAGEVTVAIAVNGEIIPSSIRRNSVVLEETVTIVPEIPAFCACVCECCRPKVTLVISGLKGEVTYTMLNVTRLA